MTTQLFINPTGANCQAEATLAYLRHSEGIDESWDAILKGFVADPTVARWENCREQGYVISLRSANRSKQLNIAFYEHRNTDGICAIKWEQITLNSPSIDTAVFGDIYKTKHDVSHTVPYGRAGEMAEWIYETMTDWWVDNHPIDV